ncbi:hypothetical protein LHT11_07370 [Acetobacter indonesiensis]|uniref:hypothetical protein n=1 Tax=Acetobacter indonesiensis TaxID=104101 RepID=UPI001F184BD3|nr:hypothetical protein [Acetobacter indonesiensis]MCG0995017.1 hypothetical protein [Acetobacter indonesiensis]
MRASTGLSGPQAANRYQQRLMALGHHDGYALSESLRFPIVRSHSLPLLRIINVNARSHS